MADSGQKRLLQLGAMACAIFLVQHMAVQRENNKHINPEIFPAFDRIEGATVARYNKLVDLGLDPEHYLSRDELWLREEAKGRAYEAAYGHLSGDSAAEYYEKLKSHGFNDLPGFYEERYVEKKSWFQKLL